MFVNRYFVPNNTRSNVIIYFVEKITDKFGFYTWESSSTGSFSAEELETIRDEHPEVMASVLTQKPLKVQFETIVELLDHGNAQKASMLVMNILKLKPDSRAGLNEFFIRDNFEDTFYNLINQSPHRIPRRRSQYKSENIK